MSKFLKYTILVGGFFCLTAAFSAPASRADAGDGVNVSSIWKEDFTATTPKKGIDFPDNWTVRGKPGTKPAVFSVMKDDNDGLAYLHAEADNASATIITHAEGVDIRKASLLKWRWRIEELPAGADGRDRSKDDQAMGIYVGTGGIGSNKSISYRWDTVTPKGSEGTATYGAGTVKVKWYTLRNADDVKPGEWIVEERDIAKDFMDAWGFYPEKVYISVCCNSQYTGTKAAADLSFIELSRGIDYTLADTAIQKKSLSTI